MSTLLQTIVNGILFGGILSMAAIGFSLIFGVMNVINLAHGVFVIGGAYAALLAWTAWKLDPLLAMPGIMAGAYVLGALLQRFVMQPAMRRGNPVAALLVTFGFALVAVNLMTVWFSSAVRNISPSYSFANLQFAGLSIDAVRLVSFTAGIVLITGFAAFLRYTRFGRMVRATAQSELGARLCGVDARRIYAATFGIGSALGAASGVLIGMMLPFTPAEETLWTIYAFIVVTLGGVGSPAGAMLGGVLMGVAATLTQTYLGGVYTNMVMFLILLVMLLVRPTGILSSSFKASR
jgi:branched-chain amino acid transport system permease protein